MTPEPHLLTSSELWFCSFTPSHLTQILDVTLTVLEAPLLMSRFMGEAPAFFHDHISEPLCVCHERQ